MPSDMHLSDSMMWNVVKIIVRVKIVVLRRYVDIVYVEQDAAVRQLGNLAEKFPIGHFGGTIFCITADTLYADRNLQKVAGGTNFLCGVTRDRQGVRHRKQIMRITAVDASPAKMIG